MIQGLSHEDGVYEGIYRYTLRYDHYTYTIHSTATERGATCAT